MNVDDEGWKTVKNKSVSKDTRNVEKNIGVSTSNGFNTLDPSSSQVPAQGPWIAMGDYNVIQSVEDRYNGNPVMEAETRDFSDFLENTGMTELKTVCIEFTWTNNRVYSRIDRALVNARWMMNMTQLEVVLQDPLFSDHTPVCVYFEHDHQPMPKLFKFFNNQAEHKEFQRLVKDT
uniref:Uncharacterized protein n=1 Tax=Nicotiana tabacum TaxID=4097 RepID=A0A1S4AIZ2_TOBAC|nr:PREDICTED: uncharacterized protein LOC107797984 [Nicotiana tabacum]